MRRNEDFIHKTEIDNKEKDQNKPWQQEWHIEKLNTIENKRKKMNREC